MFDAFKMYSFWKDQKELYEMNMSLLESGDMFSYCLAQRNAAQDEMLKIILSII